jgi:hypothetical protein
LWTGLPGQNLGGSTVNRLEKSLLYLYRNLIEPFFRAIGPVQIVPSICLKDFYPLFGFAELERKLVSNSKRVLTIFFGHAGRAMQQAQNGSPGIVQGIGLVGNRVSCRRRKWDDGF